MAGLHSARLIELPKITGEGASLSFLESGDCIPFGIRRVYYLYDIDAGENRGAHAHIQNEEVLIALAGSFDVVLDDGLSQKTFHLDQPNIGLFYPNMVWHELSGFAPGTICLVVASEPYAQEDYLREYEEFLEAVREGEEWLLSRSWT